MKSRFYLVVLIYIFSICNNALIAAPSKLELKTTEATLSIDKKGNLRISNNVGVPIHINSSIGNLWKITLKNVLSGKELEFHPDETVKITSVDGVIHLVKSSFLTDGHKIPIYLDFTISVENDAFSFSGSMKSESKEWIFIDLVYPDISGISLNNEDVKIFWPDVLGKRYSSQDFGTKYFKYPSNKGSMQWFSINNPRMGLYIGSHDSSQSSKSIYLDHNSSNQSFETKIIFPVNDIKFSIPKVVFKLYQGNWHVASKFYRSWYNSNFEILSTPEWLQKSPGYTLTIFKQQNGEVMYNYADINILCDIAERHNYNIIGIWGRGVGGHDRLYPNYSPDNTLGGHDELKKAIEFAHKRGFKIAIYTNGTLIDTSTDFYIYNGLETILLNERKRPESDFYIKYDNITPTIFALACPGSKLWRETLLQLAKDAESLGVDIFYIDTVAWREPLMCHSVYHDHKLPQEAYTKYRVQMMHELRTEMRKINPEFSIMTEGINDSMLSDVNAFQGVPPLLSLKEMSPNEFPELFRYTFPEIIGVQLNANPGLTRYDANFAAIFGLRTQIMSRYAADVNYQNNGTVPTAEDYIHVNDPPDIKRFKEYSSGEVTSYNYDLFQFVNEYAELLRLGKFIDNEGIDVKGQHIVAKGFSNLNKIGVLVWNKDLTSQNSFTISVPGYKLISVSEPQKTGTIASAPLQPNSLRLLVYEKNNL